MLNACDALQKMAAPLAPITIGVSETVGDEESLNFSRGFYDALSAGKGFDEAFDEDTLSVSLNGGSRDKFRVLKQ